MNTPTWLASSIFYEIYPQSFYDTNGDGIGDIEGIIRKLDYIRSLGCNALWLNPCFVSPFGDAGYDVADFYKVAPRYGTNDDLVRLFEAAHRLGMKVCLDLVAGHTSVEHPWFKESCKAAPNKYSNWYIWSNSVWHGELGMVNGYSERDGNYLTNFFHFQPALNYGYANPDPSKPWQLPVTHPDVQAVRAELVKIMRYWLDLGADGFRVDMAHSLVKGDPGLKETMKLWKEIRSVFDRNYPNAILMSEWSDPEKSIRAGFHMDFLLNFGNPPAYLSLLRKEKTRNHDPATKGGHSYFDRKGKGNILEFLNTYLKHYKAIKKRGFISIPSGNHDSSRLAIDRTPGELETVFALIMTMPGIPFIYNGDEIGMRHVNDLVSKEGGYTRTGARTPIQWDQGDNAGFSTAPTRQLYLPIDPDPKRPTIASQEKDANSLLNSVRQLSALRKANPTLCNGNFVPLFAKAHQYPFVYERTDANGSFIIAINPGASPASANFMLNKPAHELKFVMGRKVNVRLKDKTCHLSMPGISYAVLAHVKSPAKNARKNAASGI